MSLRKQDQPHCFFLAWVGNGSHWGLRTAAERLFERLAAMIVLDWPAPSDTS